MWLFIPWLLLASAGFGLPLAGLTALLISRKHSGALYRRRGHNTATLAIWVVVVGSVDAILLWRLVTA